MKTINIALRTPDGWRHVQAGIKKSFFMFGEEYALHRPITVGDVEEKNGWRVSHVKSGFSVVQNDNRSATQRDVIKAAIATIEYYGDEATKRAIEIAISKAKGV